MSTHRVEVVPIELDPHPNADSLSLVHVFGYTCCVKTSDWIGKTLAAYIPVDSVVPDKLEYAFLSGHRRIKARRLRGIYSEGLLMPAPEGAKVGDDVTEAMGVTFYNPDTFKESGCVSTAADTAPEPPGPIAPKYTDIENVKRYGFLFEDGEEVIATEKIHGANLRATYRDGVLHMGSRTRWVKDTFGEVKGDGSMWWRVARAAELERKLSKLPGAVLYGEVFGAVQDLRYGAKNGELFLRAFDIWMDGRYLDYEEMDGRCQELGIPVAPVIYCGPLGMGILRELAENDSHFGGIREGLVIRPRQERLHPRHGRVILKLISERYRLRKDA